MKAFVFDADGVVCVGTKFSVALEARHAIPGERLAPFFTGPFLDCLVGRRDLKDAIAPYARDWGWRGSIDELLAFWFQQEHVVCSSILTLVRALRTKGHVCVLGTNQERYRAEYMRRQMHLEDEFDVMLPSCDLGAAKPSMDFFAKVQQRLGSPTQDLCLIDDSQRNVAGARSFGWGAIWYRSPDDIALVEQEADTKRSTSPVDGSDWGADMRRRGPAATSR